MKTLKLDDTLTQLSFGQPVLPTNCYLVQEADGFTLIDTGLALTSRTLVQVLCDLNTALRRIVLTHGHGDHAAGLDTIHRAFPDAEVIVSKREARLLAGDHSLLPGEPGGKVRGTYPRVKTRPTRLVREGDEVGSLRVLDAAGHTPGQIALFDKRDATLFAGDAFYHVGHLSVVTEFNWYFPFPYWANWHPPTAQLTAHKLAALEPRRLAVGHGDVIPNPAQALAAALQNAKSH
jgi:glyoxylase-like metal-dependent hydrolase (beta-lactamase superfamily II)